MIVFTKLNNLQLKKISKYLKQLSIVSNMFDPVPILQIGILTNRVTAQCLFAALVVTFVSQQREFFVVTQLDNVCIKTRG